MAKKGSKNNVENRGTGATIKLYGGKPVEPVKLINGNKAYIAAQYKDDKSLVRDASGRMIPYGSIVTDSTNSKVIN